MKSSMLGALGRANGRVTLWLARIASAALAVIAVVTFIDVVGRYFFQAPFAFSVELTHLGSAL
jgi:TRAP-type C4-dicarboxylate transport system permease small subunit